MWFLEKDTWIIIAWSEGQRALCYNIYLHLILLSSWNTWPWVRALRFALLLKGLPAIHAGTQLLLAIELSVIIQISQMFSVFRWKSKNNWSFFSSLKWTKTNKENTNQKGACYLGQIYGTPITSNHKVWRRPAVRNEMGTTIGERPKKSPCLLRFGVRARLA